MRRLRCTGQLGRQDGISRCGEICEVSHNARIWKEDRQEEAQGQEKGHVQVVSLYRNIDKKRKRIKAGSGEKMRKPGSKGAPTAKAFRKAAKTAKKR